MSGTTSVPFPVLGPRGYIIPPETEILLGVQADLNAAFGGTLNPALETPQGQWSMSTTAIIGDTNDQFLLLTNNVDPAYASGRMQDAIARIYFLERLPAQPTVVSALCTGLAGVVIPAGSRAQDQNGNIYVCASGGTIGSTGTVTLSFANVVTGPIPCPATTLDTIYQVVPGWDTISNPADGVVGRVVESRADFELRRQQSVAVNALGSLTSVFGVVAQVSGVVDLYVTENSTGSPVTLDGVTLPAHSLYVCVAGGADADVAHAIWSKKAPGCAYAGGTTVVVQDTTGYSPPYPSYNVKFQRPTEQPFVFTVTIANSAQVPNTAQSEVQQAILDGFSGADGGQRAKIGGTIYASRYYTNVAILGSWANIISIKVGSTATTAAAFTASIAGSVMTVTAVGSGTLAVGQTIFGAGIPVGVRIISLGTGAGGTGTYNINIPQTIGSESMTTVLPGLDSVVIGVAHVPVLSADNIRLVLA